MSYRIGIYAGTFDPIHNGHIGIIKRASKMFDYLYVAVGINADKKTQWDADTRFSMVHATLREDSDLRRNCIASSFEGLVVDHAIDQRAQFLVRGLRAVSDFDYEFQMSLMNKKLNKDIETVFIMAPLSFMYLSSSMIRGLLAVSNKEAVEGLIPDAVVPYI